MRGEYFICSMLILFVLMVSACRHEHYHIQGNIVGLTDRTVYLNVYEATIRKIDSTRMNQGRFVFDMPPILPDMVYISFADYPNYYIPLITEGSNIYVSGNLNYPNGVEVSGSPANEDFKRFKDQIGWYEVQLRTIELELAQRDPSSEDSTICQRLTYKRDSIAQLVASAQKRFVQANPASLASAFLVARQLTDSMDRHTADSLLRTLDSTMVRNAFVERLVRHVNR